MCEGKGSTLRAPLTDYSEIRHPVSSTWPQQPTSPVSGCCARHRQGRGETLLRLVVRLELWAEKPHIHGLLRHIYLKQTPDPPNPVAMEPEQAGQRAPAQAS